MQRIHTMNVVPDLLGDLHPSIDLTVFTESQEVEVGTFVDPGTVSSYICLGRRRSDIYADYRATSSQDHGIS